MVKNKYVKYLLKVIADKATSNKSQGWKGWGRWTWSCQSFVFMSDPQRETFPSMVIRCVSVWMSVSIWAVQKEKGSRRFSGCWSWIEFWQVAPSKGPAGSVEDVLPWTHEHLSWYLAGSINFMVVCTDFTFSGNAPGLTFENGTAMNIKQEVYRMTKDKIAR